MGLARAPCLGHTLPVPDPGSGRDGDPYAALVETHTSILILLGDRAFKVKKAVRLPFLDLSCLASRVENCRREVELNRRLAPDVYLGVQSLQPLDPSLDPPLRPADGRAEPVVVMRRMPGERRLTNLVGEADRRSLSRCIELIARRVAAFHAGRPPVTDHDLAETTTTLWRQGHDQLRAFGDLLPAAQVDEALALALTYLGGRRPLLDARERAGLVRDGHGDLLADDIFCLDDGPRILDCLEFDERLRVNDVLADLAFLAMDLERLGAADLARELIRSYRRFSAETHPRSLEQHYIAYRAFVRAKVECLRHAQGDPSAPSRAATYLELCTRRLHDAQVRLVLLGGLPGTGKTTLAHAVAAVDERRDWAVLSSDVVRKELAGVTPGTRCAAAFGTGLYDAAHTRAAYAELLRRAGLALAHGVSAILDASWTDERTRAQARELAASRHATVTEVRCDAPPTLCRRRITGRLTQRARDSQASDAGPEVLAQLSLRQAPWPEATAVPTDGAIKSSASAVLGLMSGPDGEPTRRGA